VITATQVGSLNSQLIMVPSNSGGFLKKGNRKMRTTEDVRKDRGETKPPKPAVPRRFALIRLCAAITLLTFLGGIGYLAVCGYVATQLTKPERHAQAKSPAAFGLEFEEPRVIARDGLVLASWFIPYPGSTRAVLLVHGKGKCRSCEFDDLFVDLAFQLHAKGFNLLTIDLRAHGQSQGDHFTFGDQERWDVLGAVDWLRHRGFEDIGVLGVSLGAAGATMAASDPQSGHLIKALVLDSSFSNLHGLLKGRFAEESGLPNLFLPGTLFMARALIGTDAHAIKLVDDLERIEAPLMLIFGGQDDLVPKSHFLEMAAARTDAETWFVADARHARIYNAQPDQYVARVSRFFDNALR
jgi:pimeloyl-ACP methyl ester carboxylesterase